MPTYDNQDDFFNGLDEKAAKMLELIAALDADCLAGFKGGMFVADQEEHLHRLTAKLSDLRFDLLEIQKWNEDSGA